MDPRADVEIMPAWSFDRGDGTHIALSFAPFVVPSRTLLRMNETITFASVDRDDKEQTFILADGTATAWLAHR